jgi:hypothetical protein
LYDQHHQPLFKYGLKKKEWRCPSFFVLKSPN